MRHFANKRCFPLQRIRIMNKLESWIDLVAGKKMHEEFIRITGCSWKLVERLKIAACVIILCSFFFLSKPLFTAFARYQTTLSMFLTAIRTMLHERFDFAWNSAMLKFSLRTGGSFQIQSNELTSFLQLINHGTRRFIAKRKTFCNK